MEHSPRTLAVVNHLVTAQLTFANGTATSISMISEVEADDKLAIVAPVDPDLIVIVTATLEPSHPTVLLTCCLIVFVTAVFVEPSRIAARQPILAAEFSS